MFQEKNNTYSTGWWLGALNFNFSYPTNWLHSISETQFPYLNGVLASNYSVVRMGGVKANKAPTKTFKIQVFPLMLELSSLHNKMEGMVLLSFNFNFRRFYKF